METAMHKPTSQIAGVQPYVVTCPACRGKLPAHEAQWCHCITKRVSIVCPACSACLCQASEKVQREFWSAAPASLKTSRELEQRRRSHGIKRPVLEQVDVLVVDDDEEIRLLAAYNLEQMGYRVALAGAGQEALDALLHLRTRIVITDALMPKMDGRELCRRIKADHPDVKVVVMTSLYTAARYKTEAHKTFGADDYLVKPIDFGQFRSVMQRLTRTA